MVLTRVEAIQELGCWQRPLKTLRQETRENEHSSKDAEATDERTRNLTRDSESCFPILWLARNQTKKLNGTKERSRDGWMDRWTVVVEVDFQLLLGLAPILLERLLADGGGGCLSRS